MTHGRGRGELVGFAKWWRASTRDRRGPQGRARHRTGRFAYDSTSPTTLRAAGDLLKHGVRTAYINDILYCSFNTRATELKRRAWRSLHIWKNRKVAEVTLTRDDFREVRGTKAEAEDVIEIPRQVARNEIALFFYQIPDRTHRRLHRTRAPWDATSRTRFGGGGTHRPRCTIKADGVAKAPDAQGREGNAHGK